MHPIRHRRLEASWLAFSLANLILLAGTAFGDTFEECGLVLSPAEAQAYLDAIGTEPPRTPGGIPGPPYFIGVAAHIVRQSDGTGGLPVSQYEDSVVDANLAYENMGIAFVTLGSIDYIDSDAFYFDIDSLEEIDELRTTNLVPDAINIYFTPNLNTSPTTAICGISAFTFSSVQSIAVNNACAASATNHSTVPHEIGHYFDLFHTHEPAFGDELVDGSNCAIAGDLLCDTPADPTLTTSTVDSETCAYTGTEQDPNGDFYAPDTRQFLSYSLKHCRDRFTPLGEARIVETLLGPRANLLLAAVGVPRGGPARAAESFVDLAPPHPNPTSEAASLSWAMAEGGIVDVSVYDVRGMRVRSLLNGMLRSGGHTIRWDGCDASGRRVAPGTYFTRVATDRGAAVRKIEVLR